MNSGIYQRTEINNQNVLSVVYTKDTTKRSNYLCPLVYIFNNHNVYITRTALIFQRSGERILLHLKMEDFTLVIPTYRLKDVAQTVRAYRDNFDRYGYDIPIIVFDDSSPEVYGHDFPKFAAVVPSNTFYVGPPEKALFIDQLVSRIGIQHEETIRRLLRPSYGGNRNFTILYTLGSRFMSADDDMRPEGLEFKERPALDQQEVLRGIFLPESSLNDNITHREYDLAAAFLEVLGKAVQEVDASHYLLGRTLIDNLNELYSNTTSQKIHRNLENKILVQAGDVNPNARILVAQTFKTGLADLDATDFADDVLSTQRDSPALRYIALNHRPCITATNWRFDTAVAGYDNCTGLPPFIPTSLRTEEYILRLLVQHSQFAAAHVGAAQLHLRTTSMRKSLGYDIYNEALVAVLRQKLRHLVHDIKETTITFQHDGHITSRDALKMIDIARPYHEAAFERSKNAPDLKSSAYFAHFATELQEEFCGFDLSAFRRKAESIMVQELETIIKAMEIWPSILNLASSIQAEGKMPFRELISP